jgi:hypothetical protein
MERQKNQMKNYLPTLRERIDYVAWKNGGMILWNAQYIAGVYLFNDLKVIGNIHYNPEY